MDISNSSACRGNPFATTFSAVTTSDAVGGPAPVSGVPAENVVAPAANHFFGPSFYQPSPVIGHWSQTPDVINLLTQLNSNVQTSNVLLGEVVRLLSAKTPRIETLDLPVTPGFNNQSTPSGMSSTKRSSVEQLFPDI